MAGIAPRRLSLAAFAALSCAFVEPVAAQQVRVGEWGGITLDARLTADPDVEGFCDANSVAFHARFEAETVVTGPEPEHRIRQRNGSEVFYVVVSVAPPRPAVVSGAIQGCISAHGLEVSGGHIRLGSSGRYPHEYQRTLVELREEFGARLEVTFTSQPLMVGTDGTPLRAAFDGSPNGAEVLGRLEVDLPFIPMEFEAEDPDLPMIEGELIFDVRLRLLDGGLAGPD